MRITAFALHTIGNSCKLKLYFVEILECLFYFVKNCNGNVACIMNKTILHSPSERSWLLLLNDWCFVAVVHT